MKEFGKTFVKVIWAVTPLLICWTLNDIKVVTTMIISIGLAWLVFKGAGQYRLLAALLTGVLAIYIYAIVAYGFVALLIIIMKALLISILLTLFYMLFVNIGKK